MPECENCGIELEKSCDGDYYCTYCDVGYPKEYFKEDEDD